jgi:alkyl sulfatase BDS1-like metallo-beta-lactamase superfamily hydrolase
MSASGGTVRTFAEKAWSGDLGDANVHPALYVSGHELIEDGLFFVSAFANVTCFKTGEGLVLIDTSSPFSASMVFDAVRSYDKDRVHSAVYTHGHVDHVFGIMAFDAEAREKSLPTPQVIAHANVPARFARYLLTGGYNGRVNQRQFGLPSPMFPPLFREPDRTYQGDLNLDIGGVHFELHHDLGETDDHTWIYIPEKRALCTGDLFIWAAPNCGNPQKAQRYPREWAAALRKMEKLGADKLFPGHGPPIFGADRVKLALSETATLLESIVSQTLEFMNQGARLDDVLAGVKFDETLLQRPYLRPVYDDPEFIVRNLYRLYGGWYDGNPAHLKPAREADLARAVAALAGGPEALARRAEEIAESGDLRVATELIEMAFRIASENPAIRKARASLYEKRIDEETSLMAKAIFRAAANESRER